MIPPVNPGGETIARRDSQAYSVSEFSTSYARYNFHLRAFAFIRRFQTWRNRGRIV